MKKSDFNYSLPDELIAQAPLAERAASRLLVVPPSPQALVDRQVRDLPELLQPGDLLIFNDTRVIPARLFGQKASGGRVEILIERLLGERQARVQIGASKSPKAGSWIALDAGGQAEVLGRDGEFYLLRFEIPTPLEHWLLEAGRLPLPPYIRREPGWKTASATRPCSRAKWARWPPPLPGCISTRRCWRACASAGWSSVMSPCTWVPAPSSRCAWTRWIST